MSPSAMSALAHIDATITQYLDGVEDSTEARNEALRVLIEAITVRTEFPDIYNHLVNRIHLTES